MKFYRYVIYKLYSWGLKKKDDTPVSNVILTLSFVHYVQLFTLYLIFLRFFPQIDIFQKVSEKFVVLGLVIFGVVQHFLLYNKKRWANYLDEFTDEDDYKRKKGNILVISYLIGSILLFFVLLPVLWGF